MPPADVEEHAEIERLAPPSAAPWSAPARVAFRFLFAYVVLYVLPLSGFLVGPAAWVSTHVLGFDSPVRHVQTGSGDTSFDYVAVLLRLALAAVATVVWSVNDRRREYVALAGWLHVIVRYYLGVQMLSYGAVKVLPLQFPEPNLARLTEPLGEFSPMGLLWTFMGHTYAFNLFTGLGEAVGGMLLFFRRTTLLGALLLLAVIANVVVLNYAFDVPVKLFATHLLLMNVLLLVPHARRLVDVFLLDRPVGRAWHGPAMSPAWQRARRSIKPVLLVLVVAYTFGSSVARWATRTDPARSTPLYGVYDVTSFVRNGDAVPLGAAGPLRWHQVVFPNERTMMMRTVSGEKRQYFTRVDTAHRRVMISAGLDMSNVNFRYALADSTLQLDGVLDGDTVSVRLRQVDHTRFLLTSRGFRWVNEVPFNR
jgi:hypothetical protein